jgi:uncharacterized protein (DUF697 family)/tellurite resistance protein
MSDPRHGNEATHGAGPTFDAAQVEAIVGLSLLAATADGGADASEREQVRSVFEQVAREHPELRLSDLYRRSALGQLRVEELSAVLVTPEARRAAFEVAVCVAEATGRVGAAERAFLDELERRLGIGGAEAAAFEERALEVAGADAGAGPDGQGRVDPAEVLGADVLGGGSAGPAAGVGTAGAAAAAGTSGGEAEKLILKYAVLNGALELLPQNLATMAILPLQAKMVYAIGRRHGHTLGAGHIKEFIAALGVGATSQMLENMARKVLGGLVSKKIGKTAGKVVSKATGPMMTFATTYAMGRVAEAYYASGRKLSMEQVRGLFERDVERGRALYEQHRPQVESGARTLSPARVLEMVRGKA